MSELPALYEIADSYRQALELFTDPDQDFDQQMVNDTLQGLEGTLEVKATNVAAFFQNLEVTADAIREAEKRMAQRRKAIERRVESLREYLRVNMEACGIQKIESAHFSIRLQKSPASVVIDDEQSLPPDYVEQVVTVKPNKLLIKKAITDGFDVPGAHLEQGNSLKIV